LRICFIDSLISPARLRIQFSDKKVAKVDSVGGLFSAQWDSAHTDTLTALSASVEDTIVLDADYPFGLFIVADTENIKVRSTRITGDGFFVPMSKGIYLPVRHESGDTVFVLQIDSDFPLFQLIRGR
jgi:hypothetical protein